MRSTGHAWSNKAWCSAVISCFLIALIDAFRSMLFHSVNCSSGGPLSHGSPVVDFLIVGIHVSGISIPLSLLMLKSYVNCLFDPARVVIRVTINNRSVKFIGNYSPSWGSISIIISGIKVNNCFGAYLTDWIMSRVKNSTLTICQLVVRQGENLGVRCSFMISQMVEKRITRREERFPRILCLFLYSSADNINFPY